MQALDDRTCECCGKFFATIQGKNVHLRRAVSCKWWKLGKLRELNGEEGEGPEGEGVENDDNMDDVVDLEGMGGGWDQRGGQDEDMDREEEEEEWDPGEVMEDIEGEEGDLFHFIPLVPTREVGIGEAGPGPSTVAAAAAKSGSRFLSDDDDARVEEIHPTAGKRVIRMDQDLHNRWLALFGNDGDRNRNDNEGMTTPANGFAPFASELDWRVAHWAVRDGPGNNAFDRLLAIPGVCLLGLSLYYLYTPC